MSPEEKLQKIAEVYERREPMPDGMGHKSSHARYNLEGALYDLERQGADEICLNTIRRVIAQLGVIETILAC